MADKSFWTLGEPVSSDETNFFWVLGEPNVIYEVVEAPPSVYAGGVNIIGFVKALLEA